MGMWGRGLGSSGLVGMGWSRGIFGHSEGGSGVGGSLGTAGMFLGDLGHRGMGLGVGDLWAEWGRVWGITGDRGMGLGLGIFGQSGDGGPLGTMRTGWGTFGHNRDGLGASGHGADGRPAQTHLHQRSRSGSGGSGPLWAGTGC